MRAFISLNTPEDIIGKIRNVQDELRIKYKEHPIKWENKDKFHLTLRFLGEMPENNVQDLSDKLRGIQTGFDEIELHSIGIGFFPNFKRPNVIFLGFDDEEKRCDKLVGEIDRVIKGFGILPDKKFVPHLTLGRFRRDDSKKPADPYFVLPENIDLTFRSFYLMQSRLNPKGSVYTVLEEYKFKNNI